MIAQVCSMFWVKDSERMIDDHPTQPIPMNAETWKEKKDSMEQVNGRTWHYHGMNQQAMRTRACVLEKFWRDHMSDTHGRRGDIPLYARAPRAVLKATFSFAMTVMDKVAGWNEEQWVGSKFCCEYVALHQERIV